MALPIDLDMDLEDADADGLAAANDSSGTTLLLDGVLISGGTFTAADGFAKRIEITDSSTTSQVAATFTITGTDPNDIAQTEAVTGPGSGATVTSTKYFKTVTSITIASGVSMATVNVGTADEAASQIIPINFYNHEVASIQVNVHSTTINYTIQETFSDVYNTDGTAALWADISALADKTSNITSTATLHANGLQVIVNSYSSGAQITTRIIQGRD